MVVTDKAGDLHISPYHFVHVNVAANRADFAIVRDFDVLRRIPSNTCGWAA